MVVLSFAGFTKLSKKIGDRCQRRVRTSGNRKHLKRRMLSLHPAYPNFVSGSKCGEPTSFFCRVCNRDVRMKAQGSGEFKCHFASDGHWFRDVRYRVHSGLPVYNRWLEPMELTAAQIAEYKAQPFVDLAEGFPFPEDLVPKHAQVDSKVPFMTMISAVCEWLRSGGDFTLLRRLWACFRASLGERAPEYQLNWSRAETVVSRGITFFVVFGFMSFVCVVFPLFPFFSLFFSSGGGGAVVVWFCSHGICILFQSLLCRGLAPRVLRLVLSAVGTRNEYALFYEKDADVERCFVVCWLDNALRKICIGQEVLDQPMPKSELVLLAQFVHSVQNARLPFCVSGASPVLLRVIEDNRTDGKRLVMHQQFSEEVFLQCVRQAHQDVFGMVEVTSLVDYVFLRLKSAVYEDWTDGKVLLRKAIRQGSVAFQDLREVLTDLVDLWPSIRLFIRCTGLPHVKDQADSVSLLHDFFLFFFGGFFTVVLLVI